MERVGNVKKITEILDELHIQYAIYTEITGEPTDVMIKGGAKVYKEEGCDFLIGIGGGSPLDSMKAIALLAAEPGQNNCRFYGKRDHNTTSQNDRDSDNCGNWFRSNMVYRYYRHENRD